jgi:uncharacterized protein DUF3800
VIQAYCDESGIHGGARYCIVVGFVATARRWQQCEEAWHRATGGITFHAKRFFARDGRTRFDHYKGWSDAKAEEYLLALVNAITGAELTPIGTAIDVQAFQSLSPDQRRYLTGAQFYNDSGAYADSGKPDAPYALGFLRCMIDGVRFVANGKFKVSFVFDRQTDYAPYATQYFQRALKAMPEVRANVADLIFKGKDDVVGLQAADLLAHICSRRLRTRLGVSRELDLATERLAPLTDGKILLLNERAMRDQLALVPKELRRNWR